MIKILYMTAVKNETLTYHRKPLHNKINIGRALIVDRIISIKRGTDLNAGNITARTSTENTVHLTGKSPDLQSQSQLTISSFS